MKQILITLSLVFVAVAGSFGQEWTISGNITDASSGEDLIFSNVAIEQTGIGTQSNLYGFYSLSLSEGVHQITFSYLGYTLSLIHI